MKKLLLLFAMATLGVACEKQENEIVDIQQVEDISLEVEDTFGPFDANGEDISIDTTVFNLKDEAGDRGLSSRAPAGDDFTPLPNSYDTFINEFRGAIPEGLGFRGSIIFEIDGVEYAQYFNSYNWNLGVRYDFSLANIKFISVRATATDSEGNVNQMYIKENTQEVEHVTNYHFARFWRPLESRPTANTLFRRVGYPGYYGQLFFGFTGLNLLSTDDVPLYYERSPILADTAPNIKYHEDFNGVIVNETHRSAISLIGTALSVYRRAWGAGIDTNERVYLRSNGDVELQIIDNVTGEAVVRIPFDKYTAQTKSWYNPGWERYWTLTNIYKEEKFYFDDMKNPSPLFGIRKLNRITQTVARVLSKDVHFKKRPSHVREWVYSKGIEGKLDIYIDLKAGGETLHFERDGSYSASVNTWRWDQIRYIFFNEDDEAIQEVHKF